MRRREYIHFRPTGENFATKKEFDEAHSNFFTGDLDENFMHYCAETALHAFWINYQHRDKKVRKEEFCQRFKELINQMLKEL